MTNKQTQIHNLVELKLEIARLKVLKREQEAYLTNQYRLLNNKIEAPVRFFKSLKAGIPGISVVENLLSKSGNKNSDWLTKALRIGVPFVMNRFFLKDAGMLKKALMLLVSERAVGQINKNSISGFVSKLTDLIRPKGKKKKKADRTLEPQIVADEVNEYGIPSYSETY